MSLEWVAVVALACVAISALAVAVIAIFCIRKREKKNGNISSYELSEGAETNKECFSEVSAKRTYDAETAGDTIALADCRRTNVTWMLSADDELIIGRADDCALRLSDSSVSRRHAKIDVHDGKFVVTDLSSANHTMLNGDRVLGYSSLKVGDILRFGREVIRVDHIHISAVAEEKVNTTKKGEKGQTEFIFR